jgi:hypothetical protein
MRMKDGAWDMNMLSILRLIDCMKPSVSEVMAAIEEGRNRRVQYGRAPCRSGASAGIAFEDIAA